MMKPTKLIKKLIAALLAVAFMFPGFSLALTNTGLRDQFSASVRPDTIEPLCHDVIDPAETEVKEEDEPEYDLIAYVAHQLPTEYRWFKMNSYTPSEKERIETVSMIEGGILPYNAIVEAEGSIYAAQGATGTDSKGCTLYKLNESLREEEEIELWVERLDLDSGFLNYLWGVDCWSLSYSYEEGKCYALIELHFWQEDAIGSVNNEMQIIGIAELDLETGGLTFIGDQWYRYTLISGETAGTLYDIWPVTVSYMGNGNFLMIEAWSNSLMSFNINDDLTSPSSYNSIITAPGRATAFPDTGTPQAYPAQSLQYFPEDNTALWCSEKQRLYNSDFMIYARFDLDTPAYTYMNLLYPGSLCGDDSPYCYQLPVLFCRAPRTEPEPPPPEEPEYDLLACSAANSSHYEFFELSSKNPAAYNKIGEFDIDYSAWPISFAGVVQVDGRIYLVSTQNNYSNAEIYKVNDDFELEHHVDLWWEGNPDAKQGVGCWALHYSAKEGKLYGLVNNAPPWLAWGIAEIDLETGGYSFVFDPWSPTTYPETGEYFWPVTMTYMEDGRFLVVDAWSNALYIIDTNNGDPTDISTYQFVCTLPEFATSFMLLGAPEKWMPQSMQYFEEDNTVLWGSGNTYDVHTNLVMVDVGTGEIVYNVSLHGRGMLLEPGEGQSVSDFMWPLHFCKPQQSVPEPPPSLMGDVDDSGTVTVDDAVLTLRYCMGLISSLNRIDLADMNGDGVIDLIDANLILRKAMGLITEP